MNNQNLSESKHDSEKGDVGNRYDAELEAEFRALAEWLVEAYLWRRAHGEFQEEEAIDESPDPGTMRGKVDQKQSNPDK